MPLRQWVRPGVSRGAMEGTAWAQRPRVCTLPAPSQLHIICVQWSCRLAH